MADIRTAYQALIMRLLHGSGACPAAQRRAAFDNQHSEEPLASLLHKVVAAAHTVSEADVAAARSSGHSEDQLFELMVCAAVGQASRQYEAALAAVAAACADRKDQG